MREVDKKWLKKYIGLSESYLNQFDPPFYEVDGGTADCNFRHEDYPGYIVVHRTFRHTYIARLKNNSKNNKNAK